MLNPGRGDRFLQHLRTHAIQALHHGMPRRPVHQQDTKEGFGAPDEVGSFLPQPARSALWRKKYVFPVSSSTATLSAALLRSQLAQRAHARVQDVPKTPEIPKVQGVLACGHPLNLPRPDSSRSVSKPASAWTTAPQA